MLNPKYEPKNFSDAVIGHLATLTDISLLYI